MNFRKALLLVSSMMLVFAASAFADEGTAAHAGAGDLPKFGAAIGIAIAAFGGALGQAKAAAAALEGIARNPAAQNKIFVPMIISLALIESLVLYSFVISFLLKG